MKTPRGAPRECSRQRIGRSHECTPVRRRGDERAADGSARPCLKSRQRRFSHLLSAPSRRRVDDDDDERSALPPAETTCGRSVETVPFLLAENPVVRCAWRARAQRSRRSRGNRHRRGVEHTAAESIRRVVRGGGDRTHAVWPRVTDARTAQYDVVSSISRSARQRVARVHASGGMHGGITLLIIKEHERARKEPSGKGDAAIFECQRENFRRCAGRAQLSATVCPS